MTLLQVKALRTHDGARLATVVLGTLAGDRALGFLIPMNEANRLARVLGTVRCPCVAVYELVLSLLDRLRGSLHSVVLDGDDSAIHAILVVEHGGSRLGLSSHPADAIALAIRSNAPIYATPAALGHACALAGGDEGIPGFRHVAQWLQRVKPDDFHLSDGR